VHRGRCWRIALCFVMKTFVLLSLLVLAGCATKPPIRAYRFKTCQHNGDHEVCECNRYHTEVNPKAMGGLIGVCE
jgi:hypothetical protein